MKNNEKFTIFNKKGDITGQLFIFILALVLFGLILIYGYKAIKTFGEKGRETAFIEFKDSLETAIKTSLMDYGSVKKFKLNLPFEYTEICFIDLETIATKANKLNELAGARPLIYNAVESGTSQNVFLMPMALTELKVEKLDISEGYLCIWNTKLGITLRLEGKGDRVVVSQWQ